MRPGGFSLGFMELDLGTGLFRPVLDDTQRDTLLPVATWLAESVTQLNPEGRPVSRAAIILGASAGVRDANADPELYTDYDSLKRLSVTAVVQNGDGSKVRVEFQNADFAALRQIGHELMTSAGLNAFIP